MALETENLELTETQLETLLEYIKSKTGMVFAPRLRSWVSKQFIEVFQTSSETLFPMFFTSLVGDKKKYESQVLFERLTVHETMFFRDKKYFDFIETTMIPDLIKAKQATKSLSIWIAAGSSGQEIYSIYFKLLEKFPELKTWNLSLYSTDLSQAIVDKAKNGTYEAHEIGRGLDEDILKKYFKQVDNKSWQVQDDIRNKVTFRRSNLVEDFATHVPDVDFISCRNVLIYFNDETKADIIKRLAKKVKPGGYLILGQVDYINCKEAPVTFNYNMEKTFPFFKKEV